MTVEIIIFSVIGFFVLLFVIGWWFSIKVMREQWAARSKIRRSDDYKNKNYFQFYWGEQKRLIKKAFSPEYKTEAKLGLGLTVIYLIYGIYAYFSYPEIFSQEGINDPSHPIVSEFGFLAIVTGCFSLIRAYLAFKRGRVIDQVIEADAEATPYTYKSSLFGSIFGGVMFITIGTFFIMK